MVNDSPTDQDEFGVVLENLRKVQAARRACWRAIQESRNHAWEWRDKRDELRSEAPTIHDQIAEKRTLRDELNAKVAHLKQLRNQEVERSRMLQEKLQSIRGELGHLGEFASLEELQQHFRALEWRQQTTSTSIEEERFILAEMEGLIKAIEATTEIKQKLKTSAGEPETLWQEIQTARNSAQEYHEQMTALVEEAQKIHDEILQLSESIGPSQMEQEEAHKQYVAFLQEADEMRIRLEELIKQETELKNQLDMIRTRRRAEQEEDEQEALKRLAEKARLKYQTGKKITIQELRALMETGGLD